MGAAQSSLDMKFSVPAMTSYSQQARHVNVDHKVVTAYIIEFGISRIGTLSGPQCARQCALSSRLSAVAHMFKAEKGIFYLG